MSEIFKIEKNLDFIKVNCYGFENFNDLKILVDKISNACTQYNNDKILIQNYSMQHLSPIYCVLVVKYLKAAGITKHHMIALINPLKDRINDDDEFLITVARNRGWYNIKIFNGLDNAKLWLSG